MATAELYRMIMPDHICPFGQKSRDLLQREGLEVEDHPLTTRAEVDAFMAHHGVETTPQTFIDGRRIGGYDELRAHFGKSPARPKGTTYTPVIAVFATAALMAFAVGWAVAGTLLDARWLRWFVAIAMCLLAVQKLRDLESFTNMFLNYDLLAQRWVRYAYLYPFGEALAGILMLAGALMWIAAPVGLFIGGIGAWSVFRAVYIEKRDLKCACMGGDSNVPLGFVSLTENLMMAGMGAWMLLRLIA